MYIFKFDLRNDIYIILYINIFQHFICDLFDKILLLIPPSLYCLECTTFICHHYCRTQLKIALLLYVVRITLHWHIGTMLSFYIWRIDGWKDGWMDGSNDGPCSLLFFNIRMTFIIGRNEGVDVCKSHNHSIRSQSRGFSAFLYGFDGISSETYTYSHTRAWVITYLQLFPHCIGRERIVQFGYPSLTFYLT